MTADPLVVITRIGHRGDTSFVASADPEVTWRTKTATPGWRQGWAELECGEETVRLDGDASVRVPWPFTPLAARERRVLRVRVAGADGSLSGWSESATVAAGFLGEGTWQAPFIGLDGPTRVAQPVLLRTELSIDKPVERALLYTAGRGVYQAEVNGRPVDDETLKPGWTSYQWRLIHETTDITDHLHLGSNAIGLQVTGGWFCERFGFGADARPFYGAQPSAAAQLVIRYVDGVEETITTGPQWRALGDGPVIDAGIYAGQHDDARRAQVGWSQPGFDDGAWSAPRVDDVMTPSPRIAPPVRVVAELEPVAQTISPAGSTVLDFGQNIAGRVRVAGDLPAGTRITLRHAEILTDGDLDTRSLRGAASTDSYIAAGGTFVWEPRHTFHGFRYAAVEGWPGEPPAGTFTAIAVSSDLERTGWLHTSNPLIDALHESAVWSTRDNFVSLPTDCPQRDERLGWTGDISMFAPAAADLFDVSGFLASWLQDLALEQQEAGTVPFLVPNINAAFTAPTAAWGDAATIVPWTLWERYADRDVLKAQYPSMRAWVDLIDRLAGGNHLWEGGFQFGDWLDPAAPADNPTDARTDKELVATAFFFRSAQILAETAALLGHPDDAVTYRGLADRIRTAFIAAYVTTAGRVMSDSQTGYAVAIVFGLFPDEVTRQAMGRRLAALVRKNAYRIGTGFVGTPFIMEALSLTGQLTAADRLLTQTESPSWLFPLTMGATTTWEAWDSLRPDGTPNSSNTSFNHYAFGAVVDWLYRSLAGLSAAEPGYRVMRVAPTPLAGFEHVEATHRTPYGDASVSWRRDGDQLHVVAVVPPNTSATVQLPDGSAEFTVLSGSHEWAIDLPAASPTALPALSLESTLGEVIRNPAAYALVLDVFSQHAPSAAEALRTRTRWEDGVGLDVEFFILPKPVQAAIDGDLIARSQPR